MQEKTIKAHSVKAKTEENPKGLVGEKVIEWPDTLQEAISIEPDGETGVLKRYLEAYVIAERQALYPTSSKGGRVNKKDVYSKVYDAMINAGKDADEAAKVAKDACNGWEPEAAE